MKILSTILSLCLAFVVDASAQLTNLGQGTPTRQEMLQRDGMGLPGMAFVRPVLTGVLYRGGFKGGDKAHTGLSNTQRAALCQAGFSEARYVDFGSKTTTGVTSCGTNQMSYEKANSSDSRSIHQIMEDLYSIIGEKRGPMLVHCMWGVHSSGAIAAMALVQFCDWSQEQAKDYWQQARNDAPCGSAGCTNWINRKFASFKKDPALQITKEKKQEICPSY